ncbi:hypothetical protein TB1_034974 [Malus domestica]
MDSSKFSIDAHCRVVESQHVFRLTGVYGTSYRAENADWEKSGEAEVRHNMYRYLGEFMNSMELMDLEFNDPKFTWRGTRNGQLIEARLDRGLVNKQWLDLWLNTIVTHGIIV